METRTLGRTGLDVSLLTFGCLSRAEASGGKVALPKTSIGEYGEIAQIVDPDGNAVGLHSL